MPLLVSAPPNKDLLILHLQRVAAQQEANKMSLVSLVRVFGPTIYIVGESVHGISMQIIMSIMLLACTRALCVRLGNRNIGHTH